MFRNKLLFMFASLLILLCGSAQSQSRLSSVIDSVVKAEKRLAFAGSVLVAKGNEILHQKNYGLDADEHSYWIGSLSKQFCGAAILKLQDKGLLSVSDPISKYLPDIPTTKKNITFHQLLTHTSGLGDNYAADGISVRDQAVKKILAKNLEAIGTYNYSNDGYQLLAILVEVVSGKLYEEFLQHEFFEPLEMSHTGFSGDKEKWNSLNLPPTSKRKKENPQNWNSNYGYKGSTGIISSAGDLMKWWLALNDSKVLEEGSTGQLFEKQTLKGDDVYYGYGWNLFKSSRGQVIVHSGSDDFISHRSTLRHYKDSKITIIVLDFNGSFKGTSKARILAGMLISIAHGD